MLETPSLTALQRFAFDVRNPYPPSNDARLATYQRLFINNVRSMLASSFPVSYKLLGDSMWTSLVAQFYAQHRAVTPRFTNLALEFIEFVSTPDCAPATPYPVAAIAELLHYEWMETELMLSDAEVVGSERGFLTISPLARALAYRFAVHTLSANAPPPAQAPALPTFLLLWRSDDLSVRFQILSAPAMQLLLNFQAPAPLPVAPTPEALALIQRWQDEGVLI